MSRNQSSEVVFDFPPFIRVYKDGHAERLQYTEFIPPSTDPSTGVLSTDVVINTQTGLSARLYLPKDTQHQRLPLLIYFHGGGFCIETAFSPLYHPYLNSLVSQANVVAISIDYRKAPEHYVPAAYDDSWNSLLWIIDKSDKEEWFREYVDFNKVFMAGDSAGANIAHQMAIRAGVVGLQGLKFDGIVLVHPYFCGVEPVGGEDADQSSGKVAQLWRAVCPSTTGLDDPWVNPDKDPNLSRLGCEKVLVCVAEKDQLRDRGLFYYDTLGKSAWNGVVELMESKGEDHVFHLLSPTCDQAVLLMKRVVSFVNPSSI